MAEKTEYELKYWATEPPDKKEVIVTRYDHVQDRAGIQGKKIGNLGPGTHLIVDKNEDARGDIRIVRVVNYTPAPVPPTWISAQSDRPQEEHEWWVDKGAVVDANADQTKIRLIVEWDNATNSGTVVKA